MTSAPVLRDFILPDQHVPFNDPVVFKLYLKVLAAYRFDNVVSIGDFLDMGGASRHPRTMRQKTVSVFDEITAGVAALEKITAAARAGNPRVKLHFIGGNHEARLENYVLNHASALEQFLGTELSVPKLLQLDRLGWTYQPYMSHVRLGDVYFAHDVKRHAGVMANRQAMQHLNVNVVHGHTHKLAVQYQGTLDRGPIFGAMIGWGGGPDAVRGYQDDLSAAIDNVHGFGVVYRYKTSSGLSRSTIVAVPISDGACVFEGRLFTV